jgi:hypothetical protein
MKQRMARQGMGIALRQGIEVDSNKELEAIPARKKESLQARKKNGTLFGEWVHFFEQERRGVVRGQG